MLVLTRRENEQVLFPSLGISIEVVRTNPKNVRLGITAPREIRIIRAELDEFPHEDQVEVDESNQLEVRQQLEQAKMAIYLAQNQIKQGLAEHAELALDDAMACLQELNTALTKEGDTNELVAWNVHESPTPYRSVKSSGKVVPAQTVIPTDTVISSRTAISSSTTIPSVAAEVFGLN